MKVDSKFTSHWKDYVKQSCYAAITVFFITILLSDNPVVIASIGATSFIVFTMPNNISAEPKRIIGGHFVGFFVGVCFAVFPFMDIIFFKALWFSASVGLTILIMVTLDLEHPPAAGTALGMTLVGYTSSSATAIIISVTILALIGVLSKPFLRDLI
ncbi:MAG: HPP family protein [Candidatus Marinimicrobia bacterium]|nr:HPP family protein [Candidatus Neomarinimicrobiota bacterium]|tara:strand:+ start:782 stop:1252 length:471 start_codon:yes stop_codon:yes gene_type:complete